MGGLLAASLFVSLDRRVVIEQLHAWMLLPRTEHFSELYFTRHSDLPGTFKPNEPQNVAFTIRNLEHSPISYSYRIIAYNPAREQVLSKGTLTLDHGKAQNISKTVSVPQLGDRVAIRVILDYQGVPLGQNSARPETQAIYYWMNFGAVGATRVGENGYQ